MNWHEFPFPISQQAFTVGWMILLICGGIWEGLGIIQGHGMLTGLYFGLARRPWAFALATAFVTWVYYHWVIESGLFPALKGPGPDDLGVFTLAWLLMFFGRRKK